MPSSFHASTGSAMRAAYPRATPALDSASMRAVTIRDGEVVVAEHPGPEPGAGGGLGRVRPARVNRRDRPLVPGAAGGVGTAGVQLGAAAGAHVTASVRNESLRAGVAELGADAVIDPAEFVEHGPFDVVLELVGAPNLAGDLQALATSG